MNTRIKAVYLFIAGLILMIVGSYMALTPNDYLANMTGQLALISPGNNLLSDVRGMGGVLLMFGMVTLTGAFKPRWSEFALMASTLVYASFVVFRMLGFAIDGLPKEEILFAWAIEVLMMLIGMAVISRIRQPSPQSA